MPTRSTHMFCEIQGGGGAGVQAMTGTTRTRGLSTALSWKPCGHRGTGGTQGDGGARHGFGTRAAVHIYIYTPVKA
jgi:hypothetical protein